LVDITNKSEKIEYINWYKLAQKIVNDNEIIPEILDEEKILDFVSEENWIIIPTKDEVKKEQSKNRDNGNIWFSLKDFFEGKSEAHITLGIAFTNKRSIEKLTNVLSPFNSKIRQDLLEKFSHLDDGFKIVLHKKVKKYNFAQAPEYVPVFPPIQCNKINEKEIDNILSTTKNLLKEASEKVKESDEARIKLSDFPEISLCYIEIPKDEKDFEKRMFQLKEIYIACTGIKTDSELKQIQRKKNSELKIQLKEIDKKIKELKEKKELLDAEISHIIEESIDEDNPQLITEKQNQASDIEKNIENFEEEKKRVLERLK